MEYHIEAVGPVSEGNNISRRIILAVHHDIGQFYVLLAVSEGFYFDVEFYVVRSFSDAGIRLHNESHEKFVIESEVFGIRGYDGVVHVECSLGNGVHENEEG
ncbi:protein of unknown function (plasmid) [Thermococcus nautili]|nr:protein of unknown function [Thermococcus nautili]